MAELKDRYAAALFEMSLESGALESHLAQAAFALETLGQEQLEEFLENPYISRVSKRELLERLFDPPLSSELMGFFHFAVEKGRGGLILPTLASYIELGEQRRGKAIAYVVSAAALRPEQADAIGALLSRKLGKRIEILTREDPALIGGFTIHVDGRLIDRTVRTHLRDLKESLRRGGTR
ncbi:MAG: ATP synthase F1 subunit delta [Clostridiales bacterium]|nr:ATP synthase F1 subunit delta [Clostridiales bacterium]